MVNLYIFDNYQSFFTIPSRDTLKAIQLRKHTIERISHAHFARPP